MRTSTLNHSEAHPLKLPCLVMDLLLARPRQYARFAGGNPGRWSRSATGQSIAFVPERRWPCARPPPSLHHSGTGSRRLGRARDERLVEEARLGLATGPSKAETFWTGFLRSLTWRGLRGVKLVISDAHEGLKAATAKVLGAAR